MKSVAVPSQDELRDALERLIWKGPPSAEDLVLWSHWSRLDARLAQQLIAALAASFREINPFQVWEKNRASPQPQALATLIDFAVHLTQTTAPERVADLRAWRATVVRDLKPASPQMFFIRQGLPRPESDLKKAERSLRPYRRWGFLGDETLADPKAQGPRRQRRSATLMAKADRMRVLEKLIAAKTEFQVNDYIAACDSRVHRRMAERDLRECRRLRGRGSTRGKTYRAR